MRPSKRFVRLLEQGFSYRFILARFTRMPGFRGLMTRMLFKNNDLTYLPSDKLVEVTLNKKIESSGSIAVPSEVVHHFIEESSYHVVMNFCICREASNCQNHSIHLGCLFMGDAARDIPEDLGRPVSKKEAHEHVMKCREEGLVHLIGRDKLDETWLGVRDHPPLLTVCNCCSCCCLWKMLPDLDPTLSSTIKKMPGVNISITEDCTGCGRCTKDACFIDNIKIIDGKAVIGEGCVGCGRCVDVCPEQAIQLNIEDDDFIKKTIERVRAATK